MLISKPSLKAVLINIFDGVHRLGLLNTAIKVLGRCVEVSCSEPISLDGRVERKLSEACRDTAPIASLVYGWHNQLTSTGALSGFGGPVSLKDLEYWLNVVNPKRVVETGVASGCSTALIWLWMSEYQPTGSFTSSDLPYWSSSVDQSNWNIVWRCVEKDYSGDSRVNYVCLNEGDLLNAFRMSRNRIDFLVYDSDKTYLGRFLFFYILEKLGMIDRDTFIFMDDISDNNFFINYCEKRGLRHLIYQHENKFFGVACAKLPSD